MTGLKRFRVTLAAIFFVAAALLALLPVLPEYFPQGIQVCGNIQLRPSLCIFRNTMAFGAGITLFWLLVSFLVGRIYCSTVCPVGSLCDIFSWIGRRFDTWRSSSNPFGKGWSGIKYAVRNPRPFSFREPVNLRMPILRVYLLTIILAQAMFAFIIEPWSIWMNIFSLGVPADSTDTWMAIGASAVVGMIFGALSIIPIAFCSWKHGRIYCNVICPLGTAMGWESRWSPTQITIDPDKCISCMKCEDNCSSECIKVVSRFVDNTRCVRCFDCIGRCPVKAIGFTNSRNRPAAPLFRSVSGENR